MAAQNSRRVGRGVRKGGAFGDFVVAGFGLSIGSFAAVMIFLIIAMLFFIPGFIIVMKQRKLEKEKRSTGQLVTGYILMGIGVIVGLGFGAGVFFDALAGEL